MAAHFAFVDATVSHAELLRGECPVWSCGGLRVWDVNGFVAPSCPSLFPPNTPDAWHRVEMRVGAQDRKTVLSCQRGYPSIVGRDGSGALFQDVPYVRIRGSRIGRDFQDRPMSGKFLQPCQAAVAVAGGHETKPILPNHHHRQIGAGARREGFPHRLAALGGSPKRVRVRDHTWSTGSNPSNSSLIRFWIRRVSARAAGLPPKAPASFIHGGSEQADPTVRRRSSGEQQRRVEPRSTRQSRWGESACQPQLCR